MREAIKRENINMDEVPSTTLKCQVMFFSIVFRWTSAYLERLRRSKLCPRKLRNPTRRRRANVS